MVSPHCTAENDTFSDSLPFSLHCISSRYFLFPSEHTGTHKQEGCIREGITDQHEAAAEFLVM